jgi:hypothetical protein
MKRIIMVEPQCWGFEHVNFNAAFLDMALLAYPEAQIVFSGEKEHLVRVRGMLECYDAQESKRVEWRIISIPKRNAIGWPRFLQEWGEIESILRYAKKHQAQLLFFTSITNTGILALILRLYRRQLSFSLMAVMHGMLNRIVGRWPHKPWNWPLNLRVVLRLAQPPSLWYLVLGDSVYRSLTQVQPTLVTHFRVIDLPNFEYDDLCEDQNWNIQSGRLIFGYLGVGNITKGFGSFARIAQECRRLDKQVEFLLVGYLSTFRDHVDYSCVTGVTEHPLSVEEYRRRAFSLTYVINTANPEFHRLAPSSSFLDALFYGKPGIYLRNSYVEYCFGLMGDIGYLCDSYEEMVDTIKSIIMEFPSVRYEHQVENIRKGRVIFKPKTLAPRLREIVDSCAV